MKAVRALSEPHPAAAEGPQPGEKGSYVNMATYKVHGASSDKIHESTLMQLQQLMLESDDEEGDDYVNQVSLTSPAPPPPHTHTQ